MEERALHRKLLAIEALHDGATTEGERAAAAQARDRVLHRLMKLGLVRKAGVHAAFRHAADMCAAEAEEDPLHREAGAELPTAKDLQTVLAGWRMDLRTRDEVMGWAELLCDRLLLPHVDVHDPRAARVEVLLQLSSMRRQPLLVTDIPAIEAFLFADPGEAAWAVWFQWLSTIDWKARRKAEAAAAAKA